MASASHHHDIDSNVIDLAILTGDPYGNRGPRKFTAIRTEDFEVRPTLSRSTQEGLMKRLPASRLAVLSLPLFIVIALLAILLARAPGLDQTMRYDSCTPSGEFVLPGTATLWDSSRFFEINIRFSQSSYEACPSNPRTDPLGVPCDGGYSFTQVKAIDIAWDVLVGRGLQTLFIMAAYMIFSRMIASLMEHGEVGYDMFAVIAFSSGSMSSIITFARHALGMTPIPRTRRAILAYLGMMIATIYITCLPSLVSAMTGYVPQYEPYFRIGPGEFLNNSIIECNGGLSPVWGTISSALPYPFSRGAEVMPMAYQYPIVDDRDSHFERKFNGVGGTWIECKYS